jgi:anti-sigma B factor antagonist
MPTTVPPYQLEQAGSLVTARIDAGSLSGTVATDLAMDIRDRMRHDGARNVVIDLGRVEYMDSACVGSLVELLQDLEHVHGRIALASCQPNVEFLFKVTRLDHVFRLCESVEDAAAEVSNEH